MLVDKFLQLRILVGYLGEKSQFNWWDTAFLNKTGLKFLEINFPRSAFSAGVHSVTEAAKQLHDKRIGKGRVFHLLRLPAMTEEKVHAELLNADPAPFPASIETKDNALNLLGRLAMSTLSAPEGPVQVGTLNKLSGDFAIEEMSKHCYDAFTTGKQTFPYFTILNRLAALRMCEEREIVQECIRGGFLSRGFQVYCTIAGTALGDAFQRYRVFLQCLFHEISVNFRNFSRSLRIFETNCSG